MDNVGQLTPLDETLNHQIADTFATIIESDLGWTEKLWGSFARKDGTLQVDFGLGKYHNRNVFDGFGGVSRNTEQWTVRASRELSFDMQTAGVGPLRYEVIEPFKKIRFVLAKNDVQPISFDIMFEAELPPFFEKRSRLRTGNRIGQDVVRYHQAGKLSGWVEVDGERHEIDDSWFGFRDHSWGMRGHLIGAHVTDVQPGSGMPKNMKIHWGLAMMTRPDGSKYEMMNYLFSSDNWNYFSGHFNEATSNSREVLQIEIDRMTPKLTFDPKTRRLLGGSLEFGLADGEVRNVEMTPLGQTGFHLRTGNYGGWNGYRHGAWRGEYHEEGEYIADVIEKISELGQYRDCPVFVRDGDAIGYGIQETLYVGNYPELSLGPDSDFLADL